LGQLQAGKKQKIFFRLDVCILEALQGRDICLDSTSPLHPSRGGAWRGRILPTNSPREKPINSSTCSEWALFWAAGLQCFAIK